MKFILLIIPLFLISCKSHLQEYKQLTVKPGDSVYFFVSGKDTIKWSNVIATTPYKPGTFTILKEFDSSKKLNRANERIRYIISDTGHGSCNYGKFKWTSSADVLGIIDATQFNTKP